MAEKKSWQGWCPESGSEVLVVAKGQGILRGWRRGLPSCVCTRSGDCKFEDRTVRTTPPQKQESSKTS